MHVGAATIFQNPAKFSTDYEVYRAGTPAGRLGRTVGFSVHLGRGAPFHRLHHVPRRAPVPDLHGRTHHGHAVGQHGLRLALARPHARRRAGLHAGTTSATGGFILGVGRGLAKVEYDGFRVDMNESRTRFIESAECLLGGLESGFCEFDGEYIKQPRREIRPNPFRSFKDRTYAAAISPESSRIMAQLGVGMLVIPQKPWDEVERDLANYRNAWYESHGTNSTGPPPPVVACWTFCHEDADYARDMARRYIGGYWHTVMDHYQFKADHHKDIKGYEYYGKVAEKMFDYGDDEVVDFFVNLQVWGTPEQCYDKILQIRARTGHDTYVGAFSYAAMPYDVAEASMRLFAAAVMPELKALTLGVA